MWGYLRCWRGFGSTEFFRVASDELSPPMFSLSRCRVVARQGRYFCSDASLLPQKVVPPPEGGLATAADWYHYIRNSYKGKVPPKREHLTELLGRLVRCLSFAECARLPTLLVYE